MAMTILRLAVLCASMAGWMRWISRKIAPELAIGFTFACVGGAMFFAGILNILAYASAAICLGGLCCLAWTLVRDRKRPSFCLGAVFFLVLTAALALRLYGRKFVEYDNFSHWWLVVRHMLSRGRLPNFADSYIRFQSYPVGASALVYYCAAVSGVRDEWFLMLCHWACCAGMVCALFALAKDLPGRLLCAAGVLLLMCADNGFENLMVDSMLPLTALSAAAFCLYYRDDLRKKAPYVIPWLVFLVSVKNSGALFALFIAALVFALAGWRRGLIAVAAPAAALLLWNRHVAYGFEQGMSAQHAMSLENFRRSLSSKRHGSIEKTAGKLAGEVFSVSNPYFPIFLVSVLAIALVLLWRKGSRLPAGLMAYGVICYLVYQAGLLGTYLFTMSEKEAVRLASYARYHGTIWIFCAGVLLMALLLVSGGLSGAGSARGKGAAWALCAACAAAMALSGMPQMGNYLPPAEVSPNRRVRDRLEQLMADNDIPAGGTYYVLVDEDHNDSGYLYNMITCLTLARDVQVRKLTQIAGAEEIAKSDWLIAYGEAPEIAEYLRDNYGAEGTAVKVVKKD